MITIDRTTVTPCPYLNYHFYGGLQGLQKAAGREYGRTPLRHHSTWGDSEQTAFDLNTYRFAAISSCKVI
jgi:hypothetical protein